MKRISKRAQRVRNAIVDNALWAVAHGGSVHYTQDERRNDWLHAVARHLPIWTDCSGLATAFCRWAGAPDPSGYNYNEVGNSQSIADHAEHTGNVVTKLQARRGDICSWPSEHAVVLLQRPGRIIHRNPKVIRLGTAAHVASQGGEVGPTNTSLAAEIAYFGKPPVYCKTVPDDF